MATQFHLHRFSIILIVLCLLFGFTNPCLDSKMKPLIDVLIIGGGPGGLSVATGVARQLYTAVVFDSMVYRNMRTDHMHNVLTWDHRSPGDFRAKGRADLAARYNTVTFENTKIDSIKRLDTGHFEATDAKGRIWTGKKVVLAVGCHDIMPEIPGYDEAWGRGM